MPDSGLIAYTGVTNDSVIGPSQTDVMLAADTQYVLVQAGVTPIDNGTYDGSISGPGQAQVGIVPEPATATAAAVAGGLLLRRRRI